MDDELRSDEQHGIELSYLDSWIPSRGPAAVAARRAVILGWLSDAALPRRLAALDAYLVVERDALQRFREALAAHPDHPELREVINDRICRIGMGSRCRAEVLTRLKAKSAVPQETTPGLYFGPWRGFSPLA